MQAAPDADRLLFLLSIFATAGRTGDGRPTSEQLQVLTQLGGTLRPAYRSEREPETVERIGDAAAQLLIGTLFCPKCGLRIDTETCGEQAAKEGARPAPACPSCGAANLAQILTVEQGARLVPWLQGAEDPELQRLLEREAKIVKCTGSEDTPCAKSSVVGLRPRWFDPERDSRKEGGPWEKRLRMCLRHVRAKQTPTTAAWEEQLARDLPRAPLAPVIEAHLREKRPEEPAPKVAAEARKRRDKIVEAFNRARAAFRSVKYRPWAEDAGFEEKEMRRLLSRAGLPEKPRAGKKHFDRYVIVPILVYLFGGVQAEAAVAETPRSPDPQVYLIGVLRGWLDRFRRWAQADRLRQWLTGCSGASLALGSAS